MSKRKVEEEELHLSSQIRLIRRPINKNVWISCVCTRHYGRIDCIWQVFCEEVGKMRTTEQHHQASPDS
jgi:hypothetical protein